MAGKRVRRDRESPPANAEQVDTFLENEQVNLDELTPGQIRERFGQYFELLVRVDGQRVVAGIRVDDRKTLFSEFQRRCPDACRVEGLGEKELPLDHYMFRYGPLGVDAIEEGRRTFSERLAASESKAPIKSR